MRSALLSLVLLVSCSCSATLSVQNAPVDKDPNEPGFWSMCYDVEGNIKDFAGECDDAQEINWGKLPVRLHIEPSYPDRAAVLKAVRVWNTWLGTDVFLVTANPVGADIVMHYTMGQLLDPAGRADHVLRNGRPFFTVTMFGVYAGNPLIITHELGHTLGLAHDPGRERSVMHPSGEWYVPWLTAKDCRGLRNKYGLMPRHC